MAIVNRDRDASEQKDVIHFVSNAAVATGATLNAAILPYPCSLQSVKVAAFGVSNAMQLAFNVQRFTSGGLTLIALGISNLVLVNMGTSGAQGFSGLAAVGSTLLSLQAGDVLHLVSSVANGNATHLVVNMVVKKLQDIVSHNGVSS